MSWRLQHTRRHAKWTGAHAVRGGGRGRTGEHAGAAAHTRRSSLLCFAAAASLSRVLPDVVGDENLDASFAASSTLARQIEHGYPADVFVSADRQWVDYLVARGISPADIVEESAGTVCVITQCALARGRVCCMCMPGRMGTVRPS